MITEDDFIAQALANPNNRVILERLPDLSLPDSWLVAGCLFQTVWNLRTGKSPTADIKDYDLFYFDPTDLSEQTEMRVQQRVAAHYADLHVVIEAKNQARVHVWYEDWFGHSYKALKSSKAGIERFLVTCTCVGITAGAAGSLELYAPNGLDALSKGILAPNPLCDHKELFDAKCESYRQRWPWLQVTQKA